MIHSRIERVSYLLATGGALLEGGSGGRDELVAT